MQFSCLTEAIVNVPMQPISEMQHTIPQYDKEGYRNASWERCIIIIGNINIILFYRKCFIWKGEVWCETFSSLKTTDSADQWKKEN